MPTASKDPYAGLNSNFSLQLHQLTSAVQAAGGHVGYESGYRDTAKQTQLYNNAVAKYGVAQAANWAAVPGTSNHEKGMAMDISGDAKTMQLAHQLAPQFGLSFPLSNEPWHVQPINLSTHDNQGGPAAATPLAPDAQTPTTDPATSTPEDRIGSIINVLTGGTPGSVAGNFLPSASASSPAAKGFIPSDAATGAAAGNFLPQTSPDTFMPASSGAPAQADLGGSTHSNGAMSGGGTANTPTAYDASFTAAAAKYGVSVSLLKAVAKQESGFNPSVTSGAGAQGLMQIMPGTAKGLGIDPMNPAQAIDGAARLLSGYIKQFGSTDKALAAYNAGPGAVQKYNGVPPFEETQKYVKNVSAMAGGN